MSLFLVFASSLAVAENPGLPPGFELERVESDLRWLVEEVGPRPAGSAAERTAANGVRKRLVAAGWRPQTVDDPANVVACRGTGQRLLMAHIDSVPGSPGAIDNGAGVAVLLELARTSQADDLCLGFPAAEERGLIGSKKFAAAATAGSEVFPSGLPELTVAIDLGGHGQLALMGLGPAWTPDRLDWLAETLDPLPAAPFAYRVYSRLLPFMERSDHAPFAWQGGLSLHLLGLGESDVFPHYHQATDTEWDPAALVDLAVALEQLATSPNVPPSPVADGVEDRRRAPEGAGVLLFGISWPGWWVWSICVAGIGVGLSDVRRGLRGLPRQLMVGLAAAALAAFNMALLTATGIFPPTLGESTAEAVMGASATGWWAAAPFAVVVGACGWLGVRQRWAGEGSASFGAALSTIGALWLDPVFALPFGAAALLARLHPLFALIPAAYLLRPSALRQFTFHGLAPPLAWGLVWILAWPAVAGLRARPTVGRTGQEDDPCPSSSSSDPS